MEFTLSIDTNKIPSDSPFNFETALDLDFSTRRAIENLKWSSMELGGSRELYDENGRRYNSFEVFGLTARGSACRMWYVEETSPMFTRMMKGIVSAHQHDNAELDVRDLRNAFTTICSAYVLDIEPVRSYP